MNSETTVRHFKVQELGASAGSTHQLGAELRFRGHWLRKAGFNAGATIQLTNPEPGVIQLRIDSAVQLTAKDFTNTIANFTRLGID